MRIQLKTIVKTILVLQTERESIEDKLKPGFDVAISTLHAFFLEYYGKAKAYCDENQIQLVVEGTVTEYLKSTKN